MLIPIVHGTRSTATEVGETAVFCGRCVDLTVHRVDQIEERQTVYFVAIGAANVHDVAVCTGCGQLTAWRGDDAASAAAAWDALEPKDRAAREMDAFLRAHALVPILVRWTPAVFAWTLVMILVAVGIGHAVAWIFNIGPAAAGVVLGLAPALIYAHLEGIRRALERDVAREVEPRILRLLERNGLRFRALAPRAQQLRLPRIARLLRSSAFAHLEARSSGGPYR